MHTTLNLKRPVLAERLSLVSDRVKGIFMLLVVADHNDWFRQLAPHLFAPLTFHVLGFFFLTFSFGSKAWSGRFVADRVARYLVPFWWALAGASLVFGVLYRGGSSPFERVSYFLQAALMGNANDVKASSGLLMLWFLPCLFGLTCLLAFYDSLASLVARRVALFLAVSAHVLSPFFVGAWMLRIPFGLAVAADMFVLGLILRQLLKQRWHRYWSVIALVGLIASYGALVYLRTHIEIGTLEITELRNSWLLLLHDVSVLSAMLVVIAAAEYISVMHWLEGVGKNSLLVYLMHPIVYLMLSKIWVSPVQPGLTNVMLGLHACVTTVIAISMAYGLSLVVSGSPTLSAWITPKSWHQWPPAQRMGYGNYR